MADVTLYGGFDLGLARQSATPNDSNHVSGPAATAMNGSGIQSNYFGFKGTEDLGGGLRAEFKLEGQFNPETGAAHDTSTSGTTGLFDRAAYVGLASDSMGAIHFGVEVAPYIVNSLGAVPNIGFSQSVAALAGEGLLHGFFIPNAITYHAPKLGNFQVDLQYASGASNAPSNGAYYDGSVIYTNGGLKLGAAYDMQLHSQANSIPSLSGTPTAAALNDNEHNTNLNASYDFGAYRLGAAYIRSVMDGASAGQMVTNNATELGASYNASAATTLFATYIQSTNDKSGDGKSTLTSIGARHNLSKSTAVYAYFNHVNDQASTGYGGFDTTWYTGAGLGKAAVTSGVNANAANPFSTNVIGAGMLLNF